MFSSGLRGRRGALPTQRVPLCTILNIHFWLTDLKTFLKAPLAPTYTNFEEGARAPKKRGFLIEIFPKSASGAKILVLKKVDKIFF